MNALAIAPSVLTMTSLEIAERTEKQHFHILRDIRAMLDALKEDASKFGCIVSDRLGRPLKIFKLPQRELLILASGYNVVLRAAIIDRWLELEAAARAPAPADARITALETRVAVLEAAPRLKPPAVDRLLAFIGKRESVTKSELLRRFRDMSAAECGRALDRLQADGRIVVAFVTNGGVGRPTTVCRWMQ